MLFRFIELFFILINRSVKINQTLVFSPRRVELRAREYLLTIVSGLTHSDSLMTTTKPLQKPPRIKNKVNVDSEK